MLPLLWWHVKNPQWLGNDRLKKVVYVPCFQFQTSSKSAVLWGTETSLIQFKTLKKTQTQNISTDLMKSSLFILGFFSLLFKLSCCQDFCQAICFWNKIFSDCLLCMFISQHIWGERKHNNIKNLNQPKLYKINAWKLWVCEVLFTNVLFLR